MCASGTQQHPLWCLLTNVGLTTLKLKKNKKIKSIHTVQIVQPDRTTYSLQVHVTCMHVHIYMYVCCM